MPTVEPPVVLLGGAVNALSAARALGRRGVAVHALGRRFEWSPATASRYVRSFVTGDWLSWLSAYRIGAVVLPCDDEGLELVARRRAELVDLGHRPAEANDELVLDLLDKGRAFGVARAAGIDAPRTMAVDGPEALEEAVATFAFPCAVKASRSHRAPDSFHAKGMVVHSADELAAVVRDTDGVVVTEVVPGPEDAFCSYYTYMADGEPLFHFTKRKLRQYPVRWGTGTYHLGEWVPDAHEVGLRLFQAAGLMGLGNVEFKRDARDGKLKLIECNLRLTAADPLIQASGLDLPGLLYDRALGRDVHPPSQYRWGVRQWHPLTDLRALVDYRRSGDLTATAWATSLLHRQRLPLWSLDDLGPSVANVRVLGRRAVGKVRR